MEVIGSGTVLALQMEAGGREGMGPGQGHPEMTLCGADVRMGVTGLPKSHSSLTCASHQAVGRKGWKNNKNYR